MRIPSISAIAGLLAAVALLTAAGPVFAAEALTQCQALDAWASKLEKLPADYGSFTALPLSHRRAVYQRLSAAEQAGLWQRQWQQELQLPGWNAEQRALIEEARSLMTADSFAASRPDAAIADLKGRVAEAFPPADALRVFYRLGPGDSVEASLAKVCNCTVGGLTNFCEVGDCQFVVCLQRIDGCDFSWEFPCDGRCG